MCATDEPLHAAKAAQRLGVSVKALRLYERRGLLRPARTEAGHRRYGPDHLRVAQDIVALRSLGLSLAQIAQAMAGDASALDEALARREAALSAQFAAMRSASDRVRELRQQIKHGRPIPTGDLAQALDDLGPAVSFPLPWPWAGEQFTLNRLGPLAYLVGPLGSGKTRLALRLAQVMPDAQYLGPERLKDSSKVEFALELTKGEVAQAQANLDWLIEDGAVDSVALRVLLGAIEARGGKRPLVIDMIEDGLGRATQEALMNLLRRRLRARAAPVIAMTRSSSILDLSRVGPGETIVYCPANHSVPLVVLPFPGAVGYEPLTSCLATPEVRARVAKAPA